MNLHQVKINELAAFIESDFFRNSKNPPISPLRALSYIQNPCAEPEDTVLFYLEKDYDIIAYRLILPDQLKLNGQIFKMGWVSCIWVDPMHRRQGLGQKLTKESMTYWQDRFMGTNFAVNSRKMYLKSGHFNQFKRLPGIQAMRHVRLSSLLINKYPKLAIAKPIWKLLEWGINKTGRLYLRKPTKLPSNIDIERITAIDDEWMTFIAPFQKNEFQPRNKQKFNWVLQHPWVKEAPISDFSERYAFSYEMKRFEQIVLKVRQDNKLIGCLWLTFKNNQIQTPYLYFSLVHTNIIGQVLERIMLEKKVDRLFTFHPGLVDYVRSSKRFFLHKRDADRYFLATKPLHQLLTGQDWTMQTGTGDNAFV